MCRCVAMKGIDHIVLCGRDLAAMRDAYRGLGFTLTPEARHPFGTANSLVQLHGIFLELLAIAEPRAIPEPSADQFSFAAFNRDFLRQREGLSMLVLDSVDARGDVAAFRSRGLATYAPFDFSRKAKLPSGQEVTVGFSLAFATVPSAPLAGFFCCQQHAPQHFWKAEYQRHANGAETLAEVCLVAETPRDLVPFLEAFSGIQAESTPWRTTLRTGRGAILVATPEVFEDRYGVAAPRLDRGPVFGGFAVAVRDLHGLALPGLVKAHERRVVPPERGFGTAIAFCATRPQ